MLFFQLILFLKTFQSFYISETRLMEIAPHSVRTFYTILAMVLLRLNIHYIDFMICIYIIILNNKFIDLVDTHMIIVLIRLVFTQPCLKRHYFLFKLIG